MKKWKCTVCGYIHTGDEPPEKCPVCGADRSMFIEVDEEEAEESGPSESASAQTLDVDAESKWRCTVCGYIHIGISPPEKCPVCGADKRLFVLVTEEATDEPSAAEDTAGTSTGEEKPIEDESGISQMLPERAMEMGQFLTLYHGHPIAVHIPNGVLPVSVLFVFLALLFESGGLAVAAKCNIIIVALAMPVVIATGIIDWINKFKGRMTKVFQIKMICAGIVTTLTIVLAIWWVVDPEVYSSGLLDNWFFFLLHLVDFAAAATAGWYGGKLVFHN